MARCRHLLTLAACVAAVSTPLTAQEAQFSTGPATTIIEGLIDCGNRSRVSAVGEIVAADGTRRIVPAQTNYQTAPRAADLYNECAGIETPSLADFDLASVELMDAGGSEEFTTYIFADNYFELYINGTLLAVDAVPFTPFNSSVVRFTADRPVTVAIMGVDWEENLGLGSEAGRGSPYAPGDAGLVMHIQDARGATVAITDETWRAQTFYTSPLTYTACLLADGATRDSSACDTDPSNDGSGYSAAFWNIPAGWMLPDFDDSVWPRAVTYTNDTVGVDNKPGYTNFTDVFDTEGADAQFIWSSNLILDNLVLLRTTID